MSELIFAYGSNMCLGRLRKYEVDPETQGQPAKLHGYALRFNKRSSDGSAKANVEPSGGSVVRGVLYTISNDGLERLNRREIGYTPLRLLVMCSAGAVQAWVHIADDADNDPALAPYSWYKRFLVEGARNRGLAPDYLRSLEAIKADEDPDRERDRRWRGVQCDE